MSFTDHYWHRKDEKSWQQLTDKKDEKKITTNKWTRVQPFCYNDKKKEFGKINLADFKL